MQETTLERVAAFSLAEAWAWLIHIPYLGFAFLVILGFVALGFVALISAVLRP